MKTIVMGFILLLAAAVPMRADDIYTVTVDTSTINSTAGYLDFQFNPGLFPGSQAASLQIEDFTTDGTLGTAPTLTGDVSGALPGTLAFDNGTPFNDYFTAFTFGNSISFTVDLGGPAISAPDGTSSSGSSLTFFVYDSSYNPLLADSSSPIGQALEVDVNLDGTTTPTSYSPQLSASPVTPAPEPASLILLVAGMVGIAVLKRLVGS